MFTDTPLAGNALAVFTDGSALSSQVMQRVARELNLSETVFVVSEGSDPGVTSASIRIFTPATELPFAGHPVLGTGFVVGERTGAATVHLETADRTIAVNLVREGDTIVYGEMEHAIPDAEPFARADELLAALGIGRVALPVEAYRNGALHVCVNLASEDEVAGLSPEMNGLARLGPIGVSCFAAAGSRVKTRMFGPGLGVPEDPATGSAAGPLVTHLVRHGVVSPDQEVEISQGEEIGRPSLIRARVGGGAVVIGGHAVTVARGEYRLG